MAIALFPFAQLTAPLQALAGWFVAKPRSMQTPASPAVRSVRLPSHPPRPVRPLVRVVRVVDNTPASAGAGRMVISGRMADVCAELDRLAAVEARTAP
jgi:hypothetical protein